MMKTLTTSTHLPSPDLKDKIDAYWITENKTDLSVDIPIVPDGCIDIICKNLFYQRLFFVFL